MEWRCRVVLRTWSVLALLLCLQSVVSAAVTHDFAVNPVTWDPTSGTAMFDANGDTIPDFQIEVVNGFIDPTAAAYVVDNLATSSGGIEKTFAFSIKAIDTSLTIHEHQSVIFEFQSAKATEPGGSGGAGNIGVDVFDGSGIELADDLGVTGNINSNPSTAVLPVFVLTQSFEIRVDTASPPNNDDAQVILGTIEFNSGTLTASGISAVPEPGSCVLLACTIGMLLYRRQRN